jgi:hypothetical protein
MEARKTIGVLLIFFFVNTDMDKGRAVDKKPFVRRIEGKSGDLCL